MQALLFIVAMSQFAVASATGHVLPLVAGVLAFAGSAVLAVRSVRREVRS